MDSIKLEIYLLALRKLEIGEEEFVCCALKSANEEVVGIVETNMYIRHSFPEFFSLYDGSMAMTNGEVDYALGRHGPWWEIGHPGRISTMRLAIERVR